MTFKAFVQMGCIACLGLLAVGCGQVEETAPAAQAPAVTVTGVAVLPVRPAVEDSDAAVPTELKTLQDGSQVMDGLLRRMFAGRGDVHFVPAALKSAGGSTMVRRLEDARRIAAENGSNAILEISLSRYRERVGGDYGVQQPAAVTFSYKLIEVGQGRVVCHGRFDEEQQSLMENLFNLGKTQERGLVWLTVEGLASSGLQERLGQCPALELK